VFAALRFGGVAARPASAACFGGLFRRLDLCCDAALLPRQVFILCIVSPAKHLYQQ